MCCFFTINLLILYKNTFVHHISRRKVWLSGKDVNDCLRCIRLELLMFEL